VAQTLELIPTPDILRTMSLRKHSSQTIVGFCAETEELETNARRKLEDKQLDWIAGNLVGQGTRRISM
jgi:phosphopantothenoylcysteine decarboxylase/phosphopantothenate--cysteine ligase